MNLLHKKLESSCSMIFFRVKHFDLRDFSVFSIILLDSLVVLHDVELQQVVELGFVRTFVTVKKTPWENTNMYRWLEQFICIKEVRRNSLKSNFLTWNSKNKTYYTRTLNIIYWSLCLNTLHNMFKVQIVFLVFISVQVYILV